MYNITIFILRHTVFRIILIFLFFSDRKRYDHLIQRMDYSYFDRKSLENNKKNILVHAVSVGEVVASTPLIEYLIENHKDYNVIISTVTTTGKEMVKKTFGDTVTHIFFPLDFKDVCSNFIKIISPSIVLIAETEIWPNFMESLKVKCIPAILFNGRISPSSYRSYYYFRRFFRKYVNYFDVIAVQSDNDGERIEDIGALKEKIFVMGNLKFDSMLKEIDSEKFVKLSNEIAFDEKRKVFVAGSVHDGEYEFVLSAYEQMKKELGNIAIVIAPRHIKDCEKICDILREKELSFTLKTDLEFGADLSKTDVVILDTIGELQFLYGIGDMAFIGGSFIERGGHNTLEASRYGIPVFFGPHMFNFEYIAEQTLKYGCGVEVHNPEELAVKVIELYSDFEKYTEIDHFSRTMINSNLGSLKKISSIVNKYL